MLINICLIVVIIITGSVLANYNRFIRLNNKVKEKESKIDILLNQRFDLIPNLVECVKGYTKHEGGTFENLARLRSSYNNNGFNINEAEKINNEFGKLMAIVENYPELKASSQFMNLQANLRQIEDKLNYARIEYNNMVTRFNNLVEQIPSNIVAKIFNFETKELFKIEEEKKENIRVSL